MFHNNLKKNNSVIYQKPVASEHVQSEGGLGVKPQLDSKPIQEQAIAGWVECLNVLYSVWQL